MKRISVLSALGCLIGAAALRADVIPTAPDARAEKAAVERTLLRRGLEGPEARALAGALGAEDAAYFARSPERVQSVGGLLFEEWAESALALVGIPVVAYLIMRAAKVYGD
jgi:hypothetical protein